MLKQCAMCPKMFNATRSNAECCSSNCRNKKARARNRQMKMFIPFTWQLEQYTELQKIYEVSPEASRLIDEIRLRAGVEVAQLAIDAIHQIANVADSAR
jgi:hypothetical protein